jgi:hypothetical protein
VSNSISKYVSHPLLVLGATMTLTGDIYLFDYLAHVVYSYNASDECSGSRLDKPRRPAMSGTCTHIELRAKSAHSIIFSFAGLRKDHIIGIGRTSSIKSAAGVMVPMAIMMAFRLAQCPGPNFGCSQNTLYGWHCVNVKVIDTMKVRET